MPWPTAGLTIISPFPLVNSLFDCSTRLLVPSFLRKFCFSIDLRVQSILCSPYIVSIRNVGHEHLDQLARIRDCSEITEHQHKFPGDLAASTFTDARSATAGWPSTQKQHSDGRFLHPTSGHRKAFEVALLPPHARKYHTPHDNTIGLHRSMGNAHHVHLEIRLSPGCLQPPPHRAWFRCRLGNIFPYIECLRAIRGWP